jgi:hypothetical protein
MKGIHLITASLLLHLPLCFWGQVNPNKNRLVVLNYNNVGKEYSFNKLKKNNCDSTVIIYLGNIQASDGRVFKILISKWYWGTTPRATSRIVVYNARNQYLGNYHVTMTTDLPSKIEGNALVFMNKDRKDCDHMLVSIVSFYNGLPSQFFLRCNGKSGDIYSFDVE